VSERKNRHILEVTRSLLFQSNVPKTFWSDAILTSIYLINRLPSPNLNNKSPLEILKNKNINIDHLRVFGCTCFVHIKRQDKLDTNAVKTIFIGYSFQKKGYKCYDPTNKKLYISRNVSFLKKIPFYKKKEDQQQPRNDSILPELTFFEGTQTQESNRSSHEEELYSEGESQINNEEELHSEGESQENTNLRRSTRSTQPPSRLRDYVTYNVRYPI